ncbi:MAG: hypothetical protein LIR25_01925 [bacterium]|nr:hypothetical protein [bacterium]
MIRRLVAVGMVSLLLLSCLFAADAELPPTDEEVLDSLTVIMDCVSASLVTECTETDIDLPCSIVSMVQGSLLPRRIAYFLADPSEYEHMLAPSDSNGGFFAALLSLLNGATENPLVSAVYVAMSTRGYREGDFLLSGYISFSYPDDTDLDQILGIWSSRENTGRSIGLSVDMQVYGSKLTRPIYLNGDFSLAVDDEGDIVISSLGVYRINGYAYQGGEFRM